MKHNRKHSGAILRLNQTLVRMGPPAQNHTERRKKMNSGDLFPKRPGLPGTLHQEWVRCGKPQCHCARGVLHGPYTYRRWNEAGKQHKAYIRRDQLDAVQAAIADWRQHHPPAWSMRQALADLHRVEKG